jgi:hypothetical protein
MTGMPGSLPRLLAKRVCAVAAKQRRGAWRSAPLASSSRALLHASREGRTWKGEQPQPLLRW